MPAASRKVRIFCSYAHEDRLLREQLRNHLTALIDSDLVEFWDDSAIAAGAEWDASIRGQLESADIVLLLISSDFLASQYASRVEVRNDLKRAARGQAVVIPVLLRAVSLEGTPFERLQILPSLDRPVSQWPDRDEAFVQVERGVREAVGRIRARLIAPAAAAPHRSSAHGASDAGACPGRGHGGQGPNEQAHRPGGDGAACRFGGPQGCSGGERPLFQRTGRQVQAVPHGVSGGCVRRAPASYANDQSGFSRFRSSIAGEVAARAAEGDSEVLVFLLRPKVEGQLVVNLEVFAPPSQRASRILRVISEPAGQPVTPGKQLVTVPISTVVEPGKAKQLRAARRIAPAAVVLLGVGGTTWFFTMQRSAALLSTATIASRKAVDTSVPTAVLSPGRSPAAVEPGWQIEYNKGVQALASNQLAKARTQFEMASQAAPEQDKPKAGLAIVSTTIASGAETKNKEQLLTQANREIATAVELNPKSANNYLILGSVLQQSGKNPEAEVALRKAIELDPSLERAWYLLGVVLHDTNRPGDAANALRKALELSPTDQDARLLLAATLAKNSPALAKKEIDQLQWKSMHGTKADAVQLGIHTNMPGIVPADIDAAAFSGAPAPAGLSADEKVAYERLQFV